MRARRWWLWTPPTRWPSCMQRVDALSCVSPMFPDTLPSERWTFYWSCWTLFAARPRICFPT